jgi:hypothetical protein
MRYLRILLIGALTAIAGFVHPALAQNSASKFIVGQPCPDFTVDKVSGFGSGSFSPKMVKGKWLLINFFSMGCSSSFTTLERLDSIQKMLGSQVQTILIGRPDRYIIKDIESQYELFRQKLRLSMPVAYDAGLFKELGIRAAPYNVLVDSTGIVRSIFHIGIPHESDVAAFINGRITTMPGDLTQLTGEVAENFNYMSPLLVNNNGGEADNYLYRSILTSALPLTGVTRFCVNSDVGNLIQMINASLDELIYLAYGDTVAAYPHVSVNCYGEVSPKAIWEVDQGQFKSDSGYYCYSLQVPPDKASSQAIQAMIKRDLMSYFGLHVKVEKRKMPCWKLTATKKAKQKLLSKGGKRLTGEYDLGDLTLQNVPMKSLIRQLWARYTNDLPFIDATGITGNIDLKLNVLYTDPLTSMQAELEKNGLKLVRSQKKMKVFVVDRISH